MKTEKGREKPRRRLLRGRCPTRGAAPFFLRPVNNGRGKNISQRIQYKPPWKHIHLIASISAAYNPMVDPRSMKMVQPIPPRSRQSAFGIAPLFRNIQSREDLRRNLQGLAFTNLARHATSFSKSVLQTSGKNKFPINLNLALKNRTGEREEYAKTQKEKSREKKEESKEDPKEE